MTNDGDSLRDLDADMEASLVSAELDRIEETTVGAGLELVTGAVPIVRWLQAAFDVTKNISTWLLLKKITRFLGRLNAVPVDEREEFLRRLEGDERERIVGNLLLVLDRFDSMQKVDIQAKLFAARIRGRLTTREYLDLTHATSAVNVDALEDLMRFYSVDVEPDHTNLQCFYSFAMLGLLGIDNSDLGAYGGGKQNVRRIPLGQMYVDILSE